MSTIFSTIRTAIVEKIKSDVPQVADKNVYRTDRAKFAGYPAIIVTPSDNDSDYGDTSMKQLNIVFNVRAHQQIQKGGEDKADIVLEEVVDQILTVFNDSSALGVACEWVFPAGSVWGYQDRPDGQVRTAEIKLRCRKYISN
jgi:hypothetical protein